MPREDFSLLLCFRQSAPAFELCFAVEDSVYDFSVDTIWVVIRMIHAMFLSSISRLQEDIDLDLGRVEVVGS